MSRISTGISRAWLVVGLLWVVAVLNYLDRIMITTMRDSLIEAVPMSEAQFGLLTSVFLWVYGLLSPLTGFLADRFSRSRFIIASLLIWSLLTWLTGHARNFEQLIVVRALMGLSEAAFLPAALALIADYHRGGTRSLATGMVMTGLSVGTGLAGIGGWVAERYGWSAAFDVFGWFGIAYAMGLLFLLRDAPREGEGMQSQERPEAAPQLTKALASLFSSWSFVLLLVFWGVLALAGWAVVGWMPTYFKERFDLEQGTAGIAATSYLAVAMFCGKLSGGAWADRWSRTNQRARLLVPAVGLFVAAPATLVVAHTGIQVIAIAGLCAYGLTRCFSDANLMPIVCQIVEGRYRATAYGMLNMFACVVGGVTIYIGGALRDAKINVSALFQAAAIGLLVCGALLLFIRPREPSR